MHSEIAAQLNLVYHPVALLWSDDKPEQAIEHVSIPFAAGYQSIGILTYAQKESPEPKAVVGLVDISARKHVRKMLQSDLLSFSVPLNLFQEMENNVPGSFLFRESWQALGQK